MRETVTLVLLVVVLGILAAAAAGGAQTAAAPAPDPAPGPAELKQRAAEVEAAISDYRASLEKLLTIHEGELPKLVQRRDQWRDLLSRGIISRREFEATEQALGAQEQKVAETRRAIDATEHAMAEARALETLAALPPLPRGGREDTATLVRYVGPSPWSLEAATARLQQFFTVRFGRVLPISAFGQTALHDRWGFDHQDALDVALHPDSPEGRALMEYLMSAGIPFIASRGAAPGSSSGAHIHVGHPSPRLSSVR